ncbi:MAG: VWA domain-containing protein [Acidobacteria bacterium]|nr:VWA domain-containing protein [Acidobacteriota bacterium]
MTSSAILPLGWSAILILATFPAPLRAQYSQTIIRAEVNLIRVLFTAFDRRGRHVTGLTNGDVEIYEDGVRQSLEYFRKQTDAESQEEPLAVALLMDTSGSVKDKLPLEQTIAIDFLKRVLRPQRDRAAIVRFDTRVTPVQDFTDDIGQLESALQSLVSGGTTALYDAIYLASEEKLKSAPGRKVMVVVSDGEDTSSKTTRKQAIEAAQRNDVTIFAVGINSQGSRPEFVPLKEFAQETGGRFFNSRPATREMTRVFHEMVETLKQQYDVFYYSTNQKKDGTFRAIKILLKKKHARVQHRVGYYAPR